MRNRIITIVFVALAIGGCVKIKDLTIISKNIDFNNSLDLNGLPGGLNVLPAGGISASYADIVFATNAKDSIKKYNTSSDKINSVTLAKLSLTMSQTANQKFDFMDTIRVYMRATNMPEILAGYKYDVPKGQKTIDLQRADDNIKEYFLQDSIYFRIGGHFIALPDSGSVMDLNTTFNLVANPLN